MVESTGILVITWNFPPRRGGMENLLAGLCHNLRKTRSLFVITSCAPRTDGEEDWIFRSRRPGLIAFFLYAFCRGFLLLWSKPEIKVVFGGSALVAPVVLFLAKVLGRKAVILVHGSDLLYPNIFYQLLCVRWLRRCDRVVANSRYTAALAEEKRASPASVCVIPPGVDADEFGPCESSDAKKVLGLEGKKILLYVGRLARRKGVKEFVEKSLPKIISEVPEICFVIVGENPSESLIHRDDLMSEIKAAVRDLGLQDHVRLLGWLSDGDLAKLYRASDLMVLPVLSMKDDVEGFGIVLLEAAAAGLPAVATRVGGIPDAVEDGRNGVLIGPENYELMSRTIVRLLRDDQTRIAMGEYAKKRVREESSWEHIIKRYEEMFECLVGDGRYEIRC